MKRRPDPTPSREAVAAWNHAQEIVERAHEIYSDRESLMERNHFAERIRLIYEGRAT